jgi:hypothetical protein
MDTAIHSRFLVSALFGAGTCRRLPIGGGVHVVTPDFSQERNVSPGSSSGRSNVNRVRVGAPLASTSRTSTLRCASATRSPTRNGESVTSRARPNVVVNQLRAACTSNVRASGRSMSSDWLPAYSVNTGGRRSPR